MRQFTSKKNILFVSRAATAIYLILKENGIYGQRVLVPANICYAAVYPIIFSGNIPVFCDIDDIYGNVSADSVCAYKDISAAILPHMYGNPIHDIKKIADYFRMNDILFIEDCASALGADIEGKKSGDFGDYSIFSTGYSKTIDIGEGGMLCSDRDLSHIREIYGQLHLQNETDRANEALFSKIYRLIRNNPDQNISASIWNAIGNEMHDTFINCIPDIENVIPPELENWEMVVGTRRKKYALYLSLIAETSDVKMIPLLAGASPWRFSVLASPDIHRNLIDYLLNNDVPVSDWYPNVTPIFGSKLKFKNVDKMETQIINFPLLIDDANIRSYCDLVNSFE